MEDFKRQKSDEQQPGAQHETQQEEPVMRRYNHNKPKPEYDEEELQAFKAAQLAEREQKQDGAPVAEKRLELELAPDRFFTEETETEQPDDDERFVTADEHDAAATPPAQQYDKAPRVKGGGDAGLAESLDNPLKSASSRNASRRLPVWAAALIWLAVTAGVFCGAYMLNSFVQQKYGTYVNCIYQLTDGKIDVSSFAE